jgi:hypothetical protein
MKGLSLLISAVMLILIAFFIALIINTWARDTVTEILSESYNSYKKTFGAIVGSLFNLFK